jgi:replicative DNA helicase
MVIHAPDAFERHDSRGGRELDPEHRNGPSKTITVAHQLHLLRFANLAKSIRHHCRDAVKIDKRVLIV